MNVERTPLAGLLVVHPRVHPDERGFFFESYHEPRYREAGIDARFVQDNHSASVQGTLRGLHAQLERPQAKLLRCIEGSIFDVVVDVRQGSETYGQWYGLELSAQNYRQIYVPAGCLHGFCVTSPTAQVEYKCSDVYVPNDQVSVRWDDPDLGIQWPLKDPLLSDKDKRAPLLREMAAKLPMSFNSQDLQDLQARGISEPEAERQLSLFRRPPAPAALERPCTVGDGILRLGEADQAKYERLGHQLLETGGVSKFVPASGAATRMFKDPLAAIDQEGGMPSAPVAELLTHAERFAFYDAWKAALGVSTDKAFAMSLTTGRWRDDLKALLGAPGLAYASLPKALLQFHRVEGASRTALEEQLHEALQLGASRAHFTVSAEHRTGFEALLKALDLPLPVSLSEQSPSTDTLAGEADGSAFRDAQGRLVFRPGGHGALLHNVQALADAGHSHLIIKNIDNIAHPKLWPVALKWKRILLGLLAELGPQDRPVRVAGVVPNTGEPGGGPFWIGGTQQIVESAQVDLKDAAQKDVFNASTHFNPVDLACRLTDGQGRPFDLGAFRDPNAVFLADKSHLGRPLRALELPGLWNGAMAHWKTIFVEVPGETFNPVKTVNDLLKPAHQP